MEHSELPWQRFFNEWLRRKGLKPWEAATALAIAPATAYQYRNGVTTPRLDKVAQFAVPMGVSEREIVEVLTRDARARRCARVEA